MFYFFYSGPTTCIVHNTWWWWRCVCAAATYGIICVVCAILLVDANCSLLYCHFGVWVTMSIFTRTRRRKPPIEQRKCRSNINVIIFCHIVCVWVTLHCTYVQDVRDVRDVRVWHSCLIEGGMWAGLHTGKSMDCVCCIIINCIFSIYLPLYLSLCIICWCCRWYRVSDSNALYPVPTTSHRVIPSQTLLLIKNADERADGRWVSTHNAHTQTNISHRFGSSTTNISNIFGYSLPLQMGQNWTISLPPKMYWWEKENGSWYSEARNWMNDMDDMNIFWVKYIHTQQSTAHSTHLLEAICAAAIWIIVFAELEICCDNPGSWSSIQWTKWSDVLRRGVYVASQHVLFGTFCAKNTYEALSALLCSHHGLVSHLYN